FRVQVAAKVVAVIGSLDVGDRSYVFIRQRRGDEWIVPRKMSLDPAAYHGRKFADLQCGAAILPGRDPDCVLVEPDIHAAILRIVAAVDARLHERVNRAAELRVEE